MGIKSEKGIIPKQEDEYDWLNSASNSTYGNSNFFGEDLKFEAVDWSKDNLKRVDLRLFYTNLEPESWVKCRWNP